MDGGTTRRAELYLRGDTYGTFEPQQRVVERVRALEGEVLSGATLADRWHKVRTLEADRRDGAVETYREFADWASDNGVSLEPAFQRRTRTYLGLDRAEAVVVFPVVSLAVYEDDALAGVFPCSDGEYTYGVADCLDAFERGDSDWLAQFETVGVDRRRPHLDAGLGERAPAPPAP